MQCWELGAVTNGWHKFLLKVLSWLVKVPTLLRILADPCPHYQNHNNWFPRVWWKPNRQACVSPSYTELEIKVLIGRRNPYLLEVKTCFGQIKSEWKVNLLEWKWNAKLCDTWGQEHQSGASINQTPEQQLSASYDAPWSKVSWTIL